MAAMGALCTTLNYSLLDNILYPHAKFMPLHRPNHHYFPTFFASSNSIYSAPAELGSEKKKQHCFQDTMQQKEPPCGKVDTLRQ